VTVVTVVTVVRVVVMVARIDARIVIAVTAAVEGIVVVTQESFAWLLAHRTVHAFSGIGVLVYRRI